MDLTLKIIRGYERNIMKNLAFNLPKDNGKREDNPLQLFKIVSLWEGHTSTRKSFAGTSENVIHSSMTISLRTLEGEDL